MTLLTKFSGAINKSQLPKWGPIVDRAFSPLLLPNKHNVFDVTYHHSNNKSFVMPIKFGTGSLIKYARSELFVRLEFTTPSIWRDLIGWQFMPTIKPWLKLGPGQFQIPENKKIYEKCIKNIVYMLNHNPHIDQGVMSTDWFCSPEYLIYAFKQAQQQSPVKIKRIFFEQCGNKYTILLLSDTGCCWTITENQFRNYAGLPFSYQDGFFGQEAPHLCYTQFNDWVTRGRSGEIFKLRFPVVGSRDNQYWAGPYNVRIPNHIDKIFAKDGCNILYKDGCFTEKDCLPISKQEYLSLYAIVKDDGCYYYKEI